MWAIRKLSVRPSDWYLETGVWEITTGVRDSLHELMTRSVGHNQRGCPLRIFLSKISYHFLHWQRTVFCRRRGFLCGLCPCRCMNQKETKQQRAAEPLEHVLIESCPYHLFTLPSGYSCFIQDPRHTGVRPHPDFLANSKALP